jgi:hypothetical protein
VYLYLVRYLVVIKTRKEMLLGASLEKEKCGSTHSLPDGLGGMTTVPGTTRYNGSTQHRFSLCLGHRMYLQRVGLEIAHSMHDKSFGRLKSPTPCCVRSAVANVPIIQIE